MSYTNVYRKLRSTSGRYNFYNELEINNSLRTFHLYNKSLNEIYHDNPISS